VQFTLEILELAFSDSPQSKGGGISSVLKLQSILSKADVGIEDRTKKFAENILTASCVPVSRVSLFSMYGVAIVSHLHRALHQ
jgi:hypothetical protein